VVAAGLACTPSDQGEAPPGTPVNVVLSVNPAAGTSVPPGTRVTADYDSKATPTGQVPNVVGMDLQTACTTLQSNNPALQCTPTDQGQAPAGAPAGLVTAQNPAAGATEPINTTVTIDYYSTVLIPAPQPGETPAAYCARVDPLGVACSPSDQGTAPQGVTTINTVFATSPPTGTAVNAGTAVAAEYYSQPGPVTVPGGCVGLAYNACPAATGINWVPTPLSTPSAIGCNTIYQMSQTAGALVAYGTQVDLYYDPNCAVWFGEYHHPTNVWLLSTNPGLGSPWIQQSYNGWAYPVVNGGCASTGGKAGTTPIYQWSYSTQEAYYFTTVAGWNGAGWNYDGPIACVFAAPVANTVPVYDHLTNPGAQPAKYSWELTPSNNDPTPLWYQPDHQN